MSLLPKIFFSPVPEKFPHSKDWTNDALKGQTKGAITFNEAMCMRRKRACFTTLTARMPGPIFELPIR